MYNNFYKNGEKDRFNQCEDNYNKIIRKYHELIKEANNLYKASNNIVDKEVVGEICDALKALTEAFKINKLAKEKEKMAEKFLDKNICDKELDKKLCKCEKILCKAEEAYDKEEAYLVEAGNLLTCALDAIGQAIKFRNKGNDLYKDYVKCIHEKEESCDCTDHMEKYYK